MSIKVKELFTGVDVVAAIPPTLLLSAGGIALFCIRRAKLNLERESRAFEFCKEKLASLMRRCSPDDSFDPYKRIQEDAAPNRLDSSEAVQNYIDTAPSAELKELNSGYVSDRLYAILQSISDRNLVRKTPELSDLHELTMQRERGGKSIATFRALAPCILVLGILGTLLGVHNRIADVSTEGITALTEALIPGALAAFFTISVVWSRGGYNRKLSEFISDFDEYTLVTLLNFFQPKAQSETDFENLKQNLQKVCDSRERMECILKGIGRFRAVFCRTEQACAELLKKTQDNMSKMAESLGVAFEKSTPETNISTLLLNMYGVYRGLCNGFSEHLESACRLFSDMEGGFREIYEDLGCKGFQVAESTSAMGKVLPLLHETSEQVCRHASEGFSMSEIGRYVEELKQLDAWLKETPELFAHYRNNVVQINSHDDAIDKTIAQMVGLERKIQRISRETELHYEKIKQDSHAYYSQYKEFLGVEVLSPIADSTGRIPKIKEQRKVYPEGWAGIKMFIKERMMKFRTYYRTVRGGIICACAGVLLIVWYIMVAL